MRAARRRWRQRRGFCAAPADACGLEGEVRRPSRPEEADVPRPEEAHGHDPGRDRTDPGRAGHDADRHRRWRQDQAAADGAVDIRAVALAVVTLAAASHDSPAPETIARVRLGPEPLPGTTGLYWAEPDFLAPVQAGTHTWAVACAHGNALSYFSFITVLQNISSLSFYFISKSAMKTSKYLLIKFLFHANDKQIVRCKQLSALLISSTKQQADYCKMQAIISLFC